MWLIYNSHIFLNDILPFTLDGMCSRDSVMRIIKKHPYRLFIVGKVMLKIHVTSYRQFNIHTHQRNAFHVPLNR